MILIGSEHPRDTATINSSREIYLLSNLFRGIGSQDYSGLIFPLNRKQLYIRKL